MELSKAQREVVEKAYHFNNEGVLTEVAMSGYFSRKNDQRVKNSVLPRDMRPLLVAYKYKLWCKYRHQGKNEVLS